MMRGVAVVLTMAVLAAGCGDVDTPPADDAGTDPPSMTPAPGPAPGQAGLPPDDGDVRNVAATLTEWSIALSHDSVPAGAVAFDIRNAGTMPHRFEVEGNDEEWATDELAPGADITMSLNLSPGAYKVYCPIEGGGQSHEQRGMTTTLRVY